MDAPTSPPTGQEAEEIVYGVAGVAHNHGRFSGEVGVVFVLFTLCNSFSFPLCGHTVS